MVFEDLGLPGLIVAEIKAERTHKKFTPDEIYRSDKILKGYYRANRETGHFDEKVVNQFTTSQHQTNDTVADDLGISRQTLIATRECVGTGLPVFRLFYSPSFHPCPGEGKDKAPDNTTNMYP